MNQIKKEISKYLLVGILAFGTDLLIYFLLLNYLKHSLAKAISFILACILVYILNKYWTFSLKKRSFIQMIKFGVLNMTTLGANVTVNKVSLMVFPKLVLFAFLAASGTSIVLNFVGQKWWVFRRVDSG